MKQRDKPYEEIYDLLAIRVLVDTGPGLLSRTRRSSTTLHAAAGADQGLHRAAQIQRLSVAAHDGVRTGPPAVRDPDPHARDAPHRGLRHRRALALQGRREEPDELDRHLAWFRQILELQIDAKTPDEFLEFLKLDLYQDEIFVFTPKGDVIQLPKGATPIDFAFAVHTEVGLHCVGREGQRPHRAAVATAYAIPRRSRSSRRRPRGRRRDWLAHVRTGRARHKIRQVLRREAAAVGREARVRRFSSARSNDAGWRSPTTTPLSKAAEALGLTTRRHLLASIGQGDVNVVLRRSSSSILTAIRRSCRSRTSSIGSSIACAGSKGRTHPRRRRADGAVCAVLPAGAGRSGRRLRHARPRRQHPPRGLSQPPAPGARAGAPSRDRLAGGRG